MADQGIPHFHNDPGVPVIYVGAREFKCIGATPPMDHPHIYIDMGSDGETICEYCGTHYKFRAGLATSEADPAECLWRETRSAP